VSVDAVLKLGGSLLPEPELANLMRALVEAAKTRGLVVVPGGGPLADAVRDACEQQEPGESAAHWMAILAMDQFAHLLAGLAPAARLTTDAREIATVVGQGRLAILAPFAWLRAEDPLPHGWHVTSDSLAAWLAGQLQARRLVLLKSVEGISDANGALLAETDARAAVQAEVVDGYFAQALPRDLERWIVDGRKPERVAALLSEGQTRGTRLR
jgi:aspartokinase-like uncharacterized kinase